MRFLFTSESVSEGHPDKICDQISDSILDSALAQDPFSRVAAECFATTGLILVGGEVTTTATLDIQKIVRDKVASIGYTDPAYGLDAASCSVLCALHEQSPDIAQGVNHGQGLFKEHGAGDQGMMFGYACKQTSELMPLPISLAHRLVREVARVRHSGELDYLRPDAKAQVTVEYEGAQPLRVDTVVISAQHHPDASYDKIQKDMIEIVRRIVPSRYLTDETRFLINPTGRFVIGGPHGDTGLTGRKIIVDTYGGWASHGGGAFSGKDSTKVDRSAAYMARYVAKNLVAAELADEVEIQLAYAIGVAEPVSVHVNTRGTAKISEEAMVKLIRNEFNLTPQGMIESLDLRKPVFAQTAAYGHFGRDDIELSWERTDKVESLKKGIVLTVS